MNPTHPDPDPETPAGDGTGDGDGSEESLLKFPSSFPIKVTGLNVDGFAQAIADLALIHDPGFDAASVEMRLSSGGKYVGLTITVTATSREQLDNLYRALTSHPHVKWVL